MSSLIIVFLLTVVPRPGVYTGSAQLSDEDYWNMLKDAFSAIVPFINGGTVESTEKRVEVKRIALTYLSPQTGFQNSQDCMDLWAKLRRVLGVVVGTKPGDGSAVKTVREVLKKIVPLLDRIIKQINPQGRSRSQTNPTMTVPDLVDNLNQKITSFEGNENDYGEDVFNWMDDIVDTCQRVTWKDCCSAEASAEDYWNMLKDAFTAIVPFINGGTVESVEKRVDVKMIALSYLSLHAGFQNSQNCMELWTNLRKVLGVVVGTRPGDSSAKQTVREVSMKIVPLLDRIIKQIDPQGRSRSQTNPTMTVPDLVDNLNQKITSFNSNANDYGEDVFNWMNDIVDTCQRVTWKDCCKDTFNS